MDDKNEGNWFGFWLNAAKNKSTEVLEFVKKDLEEFGTVVKTEATNVVASAGSVMEKTLSLDSPDSTASSVKRSFSSFLGQMNTVLNPSPEDDDSEAMLINADSEAVKLNKFQQSLFELQKNPETYLCDPEPALRKQFECWLEISNEQLADDRVAKHVNSSELLKKHYNKLVPDIVDHQVFWKRYLFKKALLEDVMARQELVEKKEQKEKEDLERGTNVENIEKSQESDEKTGWENENFAPDLELSEEQQIKLLEEYENETKQKKKQKNKPEKIKPSIKADENQGKSGKNPTTAKPAQSPVSSSSSTTDDDWEKVSDVDK